MLFEEMMRDEFKARKAEGKLEALQNSIIDFLSDVAPVSDYLRDRILSVTDLDILRSLNKKAASVSTIEEFEKIEF